MTTLIRAGLGWLAMGLVLQAQTAHVLRFSGQVGAGKVFQRSFGAYRLRITTKGVEVFHGEGKDDLARMATPPFHGPNPKEFDGWHFKIDPVTGTHAEASPGQTREIHFFLRPSDATLGDRRYEEQRDPLHQQRAEAFFERVIAADKHPDMFGRLTLDVVQADLDQEDDYEGSPRIRRLTFKGTLRWRDVTTGRTP